jgi:hypothetical protein
MRDCLVNSARNDSSSLAAAPLGQTARLDNSGRKNHLSASFELLLQPFAVLGVNESIAFLGASFFCRKKALPRPGFDSMGLNFEPNSAASFPPDHFPEKSRMLTVNSAVSRRGMRRTIS